MSEPPPFQFRIVDLILLTVTVALCCTSFKVGYTIASPDNVWAASVGLVIALCSYTALMYGVNNRNVSVWWACTSVFVMVSVWIGLGIAKMGVRL